MIPEPESSGTNSCKKISPNNKSKTLRAQQDLDVHTANVLHKLTKCLVHRPYLDAIGDYCLLV